MTAVPTGAVFQEVTPMAHGSDGHAAERDQIFPFDSTIFDRWQEQRRDPACASWLRVRKSSVTSVITLHFSQKSSSLCDLTW